MVAEYITLNILATQLKEIKEKLFSGRVLLSTPQRQKWCLYFYLGRILYATGGSHEIRRWVRTLTVAGVDVRGADDPGTEATHLLPQPDAEHGLWGDDPMNRVPARAATY